MLLQFPPRCWLNRRWAAVRSVIGDVCFSSVAGQRCEDFGRPSIYQSDTEERAVARVLSEYLSSGRHSEAISILRRTLPLRSLVFYWNVVIKWCVITEKQLKALHLFDEMRRLEWVPDGYTYPFVFKACGESSLLGTGASVHALALVSGFIDSNVFVGNGAIAMYGRCGGYEKARQLFDEMLEAGIVDTVSWNSIISVYHQNGENGRALQMFQEMLSAEDIDLQPDAVSLASILSACASSRAWRRGKEIHGHATRRGLLEDMFVGNTVVDMYAKCGFLDEAQNVFDRMEAKDVVSWNALVTGYSQIGRFDDALRLFDSMRKKHIALNVVTWSSVISSYAQRGLGHEALDVFREMINSGSKPNSVTFISVLSGVAAVGELDPGKQTHCCVIKQFLNLFENDPGDEIMVVNSLVDMYAKCKNFRVARSIFDSIERKCRNVVTWTAMIGGYAQHGDCSQALLLFSEMISDRYRLMPNGFTISCAIVACARLGALRHGREIHAYFLRNRYEEANLFISNCLIDMYAKSGTVDIARGVFEYMEQKNVISWTSLMAGYGLHGRGEEALQIFRKMLAAGLPVDGVTFVVVLYACSHSGMVEEGQNYFNNMTKDFGVVPGVEHYACMTDLLGRAGRLNDAMKLINDMPMEPNAIVWGTLLSGCRLHGNVELGEKTVNKLLELNFENCGSYTLLSNIYASARRWKDVSRIRLLMKRSGIRKRPGCSWVQGKKGTATFYVGDKSHPMSKQIYDLLDDLITRIKIMGYVPETEFALHDVDEEEKGDLLSEHSEKLALAYSILTTAPGVPIRITKNLRVCGDCHTAFTFISRIIEHEVILRDSNRFHHFKGGSCSCKGYW